MFNRLLNLIFGREFKRLEHERAELDQMREDTKHILEAKLEGRLADALLAYGIRNLPRDAEMNHICQMLVDYSNSRRAHLFNSHCIYQEFDEALRKAVEVEQRRQTLSERSFNEEAETIYQSLKKELNAEQVRQMLRQRFKNRRKKAGE